MENTWISWVGALLFVAAAALLVVAFVQYLRMVREARAESYTRDRLAVRYSTLGYVLIILLAGAAVAGLLHLFIAGAAVWHVVLAGLLLLVALGVLTLIRAQQRMTAQLRENRAEIIHTFVDAIDSKDRYMRGHSRYVEGIVRLLYDQLPDDMKRRLNLPKLLDAAALHDIGNLGMQDSLLNNTSDRLRPEEWDVIRMHPQTGKTILENTSFREIGDWVLYHHERMDGGGYYRLVVDDIPLESRMIAIADTYAALTSDRAYRRRADHRKAANIMRGESGTQLDQVLLQYFLRIPPEALQAAAKAAGKPVDEETA